MAITYTTKLGLGKIPDGEEIGAWGAVWRANLDKLEERLSTTCAGDPNGNYAAFWVGQTMFDVTNNKYWTASAASGAVAGSTWVERIATLSTVQTFTNKTLTAPTMNGGSWGNAQITSGTAVLSSATITDLTLATDLAVAHGGTGASDAGTARTNLGLGTASTYNIGTSGSTLVLASQIPALAVGAGTVAFFAGGSIPSGWLHCNGAAVSRSTYAALFSAIGTIYGAGNGSTTFNLPDLRGEFIRGVDAGRGVDSGRGLGSFQGDVVGSHSHSIPGQIMSWPYETAPTMHFTTGYADSYFTAKARSTNATGSNETRPRNLAMHPIIKY